VKLTNEFTVAVALDRACETLLDIERVAGLLPGAKIQPSSDDGVFQGTMRVKVGPRVVNYSGTPGLVHTDDAGHVADIAVEATDTKGQGTASRARAGGQSGEAAANGQPGGAAAAAPPPPRDDDDALNLGLVLFKTPAVQRGAIGLVVGLLLLLLARGGRR
jgi:carbon monoxide dehydrogenase subunit G